ncbi:MAG: HD domain-containing protein [Armatimonadota bacterium]
MTPKSLQSGQIDFMDIKSTSELAKAYFDKWNELATLRDSIGGLQLMHLYSDLTDALIKSIFSLASRECFSQPKCPLDQICVTAVGGYGRREMAPYSDIDVAFIVKNRGEEDVDKIVKTAFRLLMDISDSLHLKTGYSYRSIDDVLNLPLDVQTALLDSRCITGNEEVGCMFQERLRAAISPADFIYSHIMARENLSFFKNTPHLLEPDLKEGRGGLRDLHALRWITQIAFNCTGDKALNKLHRKKVLSDSEISKLNESIDFICKVRNILHFISNKPVNLLSMGKHGQIAYSMGFPSAQKFMSKFYHHSEIIWNLFKKTAFVCRHMDIEIETGVFAKEGNLYISDSNCVSFKNGNVIKLFVYCQKYNLDIEPKTRNHISEATSNIRINGAARKAFVESLSSPNTASTLRIMSELGVLQAIIPQFEELMHLVPADIVHKFTVGEHSLRAVERLCELFYEGDERFVDVLGRIQNLEVLFIAALLHDVGKLYPSSDHSEVGAKIAFKLARKLGLNEEHARRVEFLVSNHLLMSETARLRDLNQPKTIQDFITVVNDLQLLDMLLLLTVADIRAVGTKNWSRVQVRFLFELHERAMSSLRSPRKNTLDLDRHKKIVKRELSLSKLPPDDVEEHCATMPAGYLLNTSPEDLALHIGFVRNVRDGLPVVDIKNDRMGQYTELTIAVMDRPQLLSDLAGVLHALGIDIHAAQIFTRESNRDKIAIDTIYIDFEGKQLTEMKKWQVEAELTSVLKGETNVSTLLARTGKNERIKPEDLKFKLIENASEHESVLEVKAIDTPGLLHYLTKKMSELGWNIHSARLATWGHNARDVFYITKNNNQKLDKKDIYMLNELIKERKK